MEQFPITDKEAWLKQRTKDITSTEVSALFNLSPYTTRFELWHKKNTGDIQEIEPNERMFWGTHLEEAIATGIAEQNGWTIRPLKSYIRDPGARVGSSFDYKIIDPTATVTATSNGKEMRLENPLALLEIKNVDGLVFRNSWKKTEAGTVEAPPHIELQVQHQMLVAGVDTAYIGALVGGNTVYLMKRDKNDDICNSIMEKVGEFWESVDSNRPPQPNFEEENDADFVISLCGAATPGLEISLEDERTSRLAGVYKEASDQVKAAELRKKAAKAELLTLLGDASKAYGPGFTISRGYTSEKVVESFTKKGFPTFRINYKKPSQGK